MAELIYLSVVIKIFLSSLFSCKQLTLPGDDLAMFVVTATELYKTVLTVGQYQIFHQLTDLKLIKS